MESVRIKRKYQITIPKKIRERLGIREGDKLKMKIKENTVVIEVPKKEKNPSDALWKVFGKSMDIDAVKLVEESWE
jgi:AbrB family looped-hinge helix DNA binding protein